MLCQKSFGTIECNENQACVIKRDLRMYCIEGFNEGEVCKDDKGCDCYTFDSTNEGIITPRKCKKDQICSSKYGKPKCAEKTIQNNEARTFHPRPSYYLNSMADEHRECCCARSR